MKRRNCAWCNAEFFPDPPKRKYCTSNCLKEFEKKYIREYMTINRYKYKEKVLECSKLWKEKNREHIREVARNYYKTTKRHSERYKDYMRNYRKKYRRIRYQNLNLELYDQLTKRCMIKDCGFSITVDLHHIDKNKRNNHESNLIGICPSHHQVIHRLNYKLMFDGNYWNLSK